MLSNDPHDPSFLSPGHFLIGSSLMCHPEPDLQDQPVGRLSRWQYIQQLHQQLWKRWSQDYLNGLQQRRKWSATKSNLHPGTVVILREDNVLPLHWRLAVVEEVHPGKDGLVRVATIRTANNMFKRPINKLCVLPFQEDDVKC